jgi:hypothetical protein
MLNTDRTLNQRVPGSSLGAPTKQKFLVSNSFARCRLRPNGSRATLFIVGLRTVRLAVRLFLCFCIFAPFDTARRSDGTGRSS